MKISTIIIHGFLNEHPLLDLISDKTSCQTLLNNKFNEKKLNAQTVKRKSDTWKGIISLKT